MLLFFQGEIPTVGTTEELVVKTQAEGPGTHQLLELPLPVAQLLVHAEADLSALQCGDDLQLSVLVLDDVVLQHQTQDLASCKHNSRSSLISRRRTSASLQQNIEPKEGKCKSILQKKHRKKKKIIAYKRIFKSRWIVELLLNYCTTLKL